MRQFGLSWHFTWVCRNTPVELSPKELDRLGALSLWDDTGDIRLVCRTFGVSRATLYRWRACFTICERVDLFIGLCAGTISFSVSSGVCLWSLMNLKQGTSWSVGHPATLFPVPECCHAHSDHHCEIGL
jgi:hypothetical protein